jgi:iron complex outermembrane receptor protein
MEDLGMKAKVVMLLCGAAFAFGAGHASAQTSVASDSVATPKGGSDGEIIVTARKRDETLQNVPVAVTAIGGEALQTSLASDLTKLTEMAPQVAIGEGGSGTGAVISIRGISSSSSDAGFDQSVLVEIDGVPFSRGSIIGTRLFDIQNVQVLSGPQALFFGKNSPAGVISINSAEPTFDFNAFALAGYEFVADQAYSEGAISGPLSSTLAARFAYRVSTQKGWMRNVAPIVPGVLNPAISTVGANFGKRQPATDELAGRLSLLWQPDDSFTAKLRFTVNSLDGNSGNGNTEPYCIAPTVTPVALGRFPLPGSDCKANRVTSHGGVPAEYAKNIRLANGGKPYLDKMFYFGALELNKSFGNVDLVSTTGYYHEDIKLMNTTDWSPYASVWAAARYRYELLTQELRMSTKFDGPINFMIGGYYEHSSRPFDNVPEILHVFNPAANNYASADMTSVTKGEYVSAFAEATWNITPEVELSGGARWSKDTKRLNQVNNSLGPNFQHLRAVGNHFRARYSDQNVSPEVTLTWRPDQNNTVYAAFKTGYKSGGISNPFLLTAATTPQQVLFKPEKSKGFEVGYKATVADGRLRFDLNAYSYKYDDLQVVSADNSSTIIVFNLTNAAASRVKGVQASFNWQATDDLRFNGNIGLNSAKYTRFNTAQCYAGQTTATGCIDLRPDQAGLQGAQDLSGKRLIRAPKLTYSFGGTYSPELVADWKTELSASASYSSKYSASTDNAPGGLQKSYWVVNAALKVGPADGGYEFALIGRNLTNSYYKMQAFSWTAAGNPNQFVGFWNRPREVAVQGTVRF